jgi:hypothetical protein
MNSDDLVKRSSDLEEDCYKKNFGTNVKI